MLKNRLEAFSDWVIAIAITIMILEIKVPNWETFVSLLSLYHSFFSYLLSFIFISIYWNTHHHLFNFVDKINWKVLLANNFFLFCITIVSFSTWWLAESEFSRDSIIFYGITIIFCWISYNILTNTLLKIKENTFLRKSIWYDLKGKISTFLLILGTILAYLNIYITISIFLFVILLRFIPDERLEKY